MTNFEAFTTVKEHLLKQNKRAVKKSTLGKDKCMYRGDDGLKCAVGCLIPDNEYDEGFENKTVSDITYLNCLNGLDEEMLCKLQDIHDEFETDEWESALNDLGHEFFYEV